MDMLGMLLKLMKMHKRLAAQQIGLQISYVMFLSSSNPKDILVLMLCRL